MKANGDWYLGLSLVLPGLTVETGVVAAALEEPPGWRCVSETILEGAGVHMTSGGDAGLEYKMGEG